MPIKKYLGVIFVTGLIVWGADTKFHLYLHGHKDSFGAIQSIASIIALVAGAIWAYTQFVMQRQSVWNVQMRIEHRVLPHFDPEKAILIVDVYYKNIGKCVFNPADDGMDLYVGVVPPSASSESSNIPMRFGTLDIPNGWSEDLLVNGFDLLQAYRSGDGKLNQIDLEPGLELHETAATVVPKNTLMMVLVVLYGPHGNVFDPQKGKGPSLDEQILVFSSIPPNIAPPPCPASPIREPEQGQRGRRVRRKRRTAG